MRTLTSLEQNQVSGGVISNITYDYALAEEMGQILLNIHIKGDVSDIQNIIKGLNTSPSPEQNVLPE